MRGAVLLLAGCVCGAADEPVDLADGGEVCDPTLGDGVGELLAAARARWGTDVRFVSTGGTVDPATGWLPDEAVDLYAFVAAADGVAVGSCDALGCEDDPEGPAAAVIREWTLDSSGLVEVLPDDVDYGERLYLTVVAAGSESRRCGGGGPRVPTDLPADRAVYVANFTVDGPWVYVDGVTGAVLCVTDP